MLQRINTCGKNYRIQGEMIKHDRVQVQYGHLEMEISGPGLKFQ